MSYGYTPIKGDRLVNLVKDLKTEAIDDYDCQTDDEIADFIVSNTSKAISSNDFNKALVYRLILTLLKSHKGATLEQISHTLSRAEKRISKEQQEQIQELLKKI